jgi:hypothetical protein
MKTVIAVAVTSAVLAAGATAGIETLITGRQIAAHTITLRNIAPKTVATLQGQRGPRGYRGDPGPTGPQGPPISTHTTSVCVAQVQTIDKGIRDVLTPCVVYGSGFVAYIQ